MISDEAFNMNYILTTVMMLILWTGIDEPMWTCALLSTVLFFFFFSYEISFLQYYRITHVTHVIRQAVFNCLVVSF